MARRPREKLPRNAEGDYLLNLRQTIFLTLKADTAPAKAVQRFVNALAEAQFGPDPSDAARVDIFEAWLKGNVKGTDARVTILLQGLGEQLHRVAPDLMTILHAFARADRDGGGSGEPVS